MAGCLSFLSGQYGLGCDTVDSYEVVLADGSLVHASSENHSDLYKALKGGGNQFGQSRAELLSTCESEADVD